MKNPNNLLSLIIPLSALTKNPTSTSLLQNRCLAIHNIMNGILPTMTIPFALPQR